MVRTHTSPFRGGYYSHGKQFIEHLPIPQATAVQRTEIEQLVGELIAAIDDAQEAGTPHQRNIHKGNAQTLRGTIESYVTTLFGLSIPEMAVVRAVLPPPA